MRSSKLRRCTSWSRERLVEQLVLQLLDGVVQRLDGGEVAVHDVVEQPVQQVADAGVGQVGAVVPVVEHGADVQAVVLADGDQRPRRDERGQLAGGQLAGRRRPGARRRRAGTGGCGSGPAWAARGTCTASSTASGCSPNSALSTARSSRSGLCRSSQTTADSSARPVADVSDREALALQLAAPVQPGPGLAAGRRRACAMACRRPRPAGRGRGTSAPAAARRQRQAGRRQRRRRQGRIAARPGRVMLGQRQSSPRGRRGASRPRGAGRGTHCVHHLAGRLDAGIACWRGRTARGQPVRHPRARR